MAVVRRMRLGTGRRLGGSCKRTRRLVERLSPTTRGNERGAAQVRVGNRKVGIRPQLRGGDIVVVYEYPGAANVKTEIYGCKK